jgi:DNA-binding NarL/FixJ family response regulator
MAQRTLPVTSQHMDVLRELLHDGADNAEIADRLDLDVQTVKSHLRRLLAAAGCQTRTELVVRVLRGQLRLRVVAQPALFVDPAEAQGAL